MTRPIRGHARELTPSPALTMIKCGRFAICRRGLVGGKRKSNISGPSNNWSKRWNAKIA